MYLGEGFVRPAVFQVPPFSVLEAVVITGIFTARDKTYSKGMKGGSAENNITAWRHVGRLRTTANDSPNRASD